jgi:LuxR family maltose regulon positive regulatory protein
MAAEAFNFPLLRTKLHRPLVPIDHVHRTRLLERLEQRRQRPLTLVSAAAGYGKSTLVSGWLDSCAIPSAWLSLDENDNDLRLFLSYLLAAIRTMFPDAVRHTLEFVNAENLPPLPVLTGSLINELDLIQQNFILALDDVHLIQERAVHCLLTEILRHPPAPCIWC